MAGPVIQVERCSRHPEEVVFIPVLLSSIPCCPGTFLVFAGSDWTWTQTLVFHSGPTPAWLRTGPAKNWSSLGEMMIISNRAKPVVGKTLSCLCISPPAAGLHGRSLQILFGRDSGQKLLGKWQLVPSSLNRSFSLWYVFPSAFPFSSCTLFLRREVGLKKTSPPLPKLPLLLPRLRSVSSLLPGWLLCYKEAGTLCCQGRGDAEGARSPF